MEFRQERGVDFESYLWAKSVPVALCSLPAFEIDLEFESQ